ncbi:MAG: translesion DNA synthesis-associated protein ImuA [Gammaproteobacteria bacterium]
MSAVLDDVLARPDVWRGQAVLPAVDQTVSTGFGDLDRQIGGWPRGALTEVLVDGEGLGELSLLMPALAQLSEQSRWIAWVAPPYVPYAPELVRRGVDPSRVLIVRPKTPEDTLWALEQALRSGTCSAVLAWPGLLDERALRRLQVAAGSGDCWGIVFQSGRAIRRASPAALRLRLQPRERGVTLDIIKCRRHGSGQLALDLY